MIDTPYPPPSISLEESAHFRAYFRQSLQAELKKACQQIQSNSRSPVQFKEEMSYLFTLLENVRHHADLYPCAIDLILVANLWPWRFGFTERWEAEVRFAYHAASQLGFNKPAAQLLSWLATFLVIRGYDAEALNQCYAAIDLSRTNQAVMPLTDATIAAVEVLLRSHDPGGIAEAERLLTGTETDPIIRNADGADRSYALMQLSTIWAYLFRRKGQLGMAVEAANQSVFWLEKMGDAADLNVAAEIYRTRGLYLWAKSEYVAALNDLNKSRRLFAQQGNEDAETYTSGTLGLVFWSQGEFDLAEAAIRVSLDYAEQHHLDERLIAETGMMGLVYLFRGHLPEALQHIQHALATATRLGNAAHIANVHGNRGIVHLHMGAVQDACKDLEYDSQVETQMGRQEGLAGAYVNLSRCYLILGDASRALHFAEQGLELANRLDIPAQQVVALRVIAENDIGTERKIALLNEALVLSRKTGRQFDEAACLLSLSGLIQDSSQSKELRNQAMEILQKIRATEWLGNWSPFGSPFMPALA